jgi:hypothetical protein
MSIPILEEGTPAESLRGRAEGRLDRSKNRPKLVPERRRHRRAAEIVEIGHNGVVARCFDGGFAVRILASLYKRERIANLLTWLINQPWASARSGSTSASCRASTPPS